MESSNTSEKSEKRQGDRLQNKAVDQNAVDVAALLAAGSVVVVDLEVSLRLR